MTSEHFEGLELPCGCRLEDEAQTAHEAVRETYVEDALLAQSAWACPASRHARFAVPAPGAVLEPLPESDPAHHLRARAIESVGQVRAMTRECIATCPHWYTAQPQVLQACKLWRHREKGSPEVEGPYTTADVQALDLIDSGIAGESAYTRKLRKRTT